MEDFENNKEYLVKRREELMRPILMQIMFTDDKNDVLLLAAAMIERGYSILKEQYNRDGAVRLVQTLIDIVDEK